MHSETVNETVYRLVKLEANRSLVRQYTALTIHSETVYCLTMDLFTSSFTISIRPVYCLSLDLFTSSFTISILPFIQMLINLEIEILKSLLATEFAI